MTKTICLMVALAIGGPALAADKAPAAAAPAAAPAGAPAAAAPGAPSGMPDMTKMGPLSRAVTKEDKKGIDETYKGFQEAMKKGDLAAAAEYVDFPVIMMSDDSKGVAKSFNASKEQWTAIFAPFAQNMPKDMKMTSTHTPTFLSDTLAVAIEKVSLTMGKTKGKYNAMAVLTQMDGKWKFKQMAEAGWGDMPAPGATAAKPAAAPAAPAKTAAGPAPVAKPALVPAAAKK